MHRAHERLLLWADIVTVHLTQFRMYVISQINHALSIARVVLLALFIALIVWPDSVTRLNVVRVGILLEVVFLALNLSLVVIRPRYLIWQMQEQQIDTMRRGDWVFVALGVFVLTGWSLELFLLQYA